MNFSRPALAVFVSGLSFAACSGTEPTTGSTAGSAGIVGTSGDSGVAGGSTAGTGSGTGGSAAGSATTGGSGAGTGGAAGSATAGSGGSGAGTGGGGGSGGLSSNTEGPCDIYMKGSTPCVAAYSTVRRLLSTYTGPLYQVRSGSNAMNNTGTGGMTHDIPQTADGFADIAAQATACANTICTVSKLYDQSGKGNDIIRGVKGLAGNGDCTHLDDYETTIGRTDTKDKIKVGGHDVHSLYMEKCQGYRQTVIGNGMPVDAEPQGIYMVADGTRTGDACCWDFGNVTRDPTQYHVMNTLFFGTGYWGKGSEVKSPGAPFDGPWFGADIEAGVWMGGSKEGDPGWGDLNTAKNAPPNPENPSLWVKYALGFLKTGTGPNRYALRMADVQTATMVKTAYAGAYPQGRMFDAQGSVVLGVGGDNSNNSWSTFYEGAIVAGFPTDATEDAILQNLKAVGYGK